MTSFSRSCSPTAAVRKILSPQITGDDQPQPGISAFQTTFSVVLQVSGSVSPSAKPSTCAPRNCGQLIVSADTTFAEMEAAAVDTAMMTHKVSRSMVALLRSVERTIDQDDATRLRRPKCGRRR